MVAVEAGATGGTLRAGELAIQSGRRLLVLGFAHGDPDGNAKLISTGGLCIASRIELVAELRRLSEGNPGGQLALI